MRQACMPTDMPETWHALAAYDIALDCNTAPVLAMGAWFKNTLCITQGNHAWVSHSAGDLDNPDACRQHENMARQMLTQSGIRPSAIAHDLHPDFHSTRFAGQLAAELGVPLIPVQHHHAHIAAVCAEHGIKQPVLGLALDGVGLGTDGKAWGGELLLVNSADCQRLGHLRELPLPGGDRAAREPWRMGAAALHILGRDDDITRRYEHQAGAATIAGMLQRDLNCPQTSSLGRWFDAAAGLLGICDKMAFEAQAAIQLEQLAQQHGIVAAMQNGYTLQDGILDFSPLLAELANSNNIAHAAALFHATVAQGLADWVCTTARQHNIHTVALGGGCFLNRIMTAALLPELASHGVTALMPRQLPPGDSAIALGQGWVAMHHSGV